MRMLPLKHLWEEKGSMKKFNILTLGCQMNERDSETLAGMLTEMGYEQIDDRNQADIAIINTCSVRDHADRRFFGMMGQLKKIKEKNPNVIYLDSFAKITDYIKNNVQEKDLVITVGAGPVNKISQDLVKEN